METENKGTENQDLDKTSPASESVISEEKAVAKFTALRSRAQAAELEAAELKGKLAGIQEAATKTAPPAVSPLDAEITRQAAEGIAEDDMTISPAIYRKHELFKEQVANQNAETPAPETKPGEPEEKVEAKKQEPPTQQEILDAAGDPAIAAAMEL